MKCKEVLITLCFILTIPVYSFACVGARPMAMGGAFTGLSDDINAAYWNPAGLVQLENNQITYTRTLTDRDDYNYDDFIAYARSFDSEWAIGGTFINSGFDAGNYGQLVDYWFVCSYAIKTGENFSLGGNLRILHSEIDVLNYSSARGVYESSDDDTSIEIDLALFWKPQDNFSVGLLIQNFNEAKLFGVKSIRNVRPGIAFRVNDDVILTADIYDFLGESEDEPIDVSKNFRLGIEGRINENLLLRGGLYNPNSKTDAAKAITLGAGFLLMDETFSLDYCLMYWTDLPSNADVDEFVHQLGIVFRW